nr:uncharacterized protein LOC129478876 [Symphalangus syndactylus]
MSRPQVWLCPQEPAFSLRSSHSLPGPHPAPPPAQFCSDRARHSPAQPREAPPALGGPAQPLPPPAPSPSLSAGSELGTCPHPGLKRRSAVWSALAPGSRHPSRRRALEHCTVTEGSDPIWVKLGPPCRLNQEEEVS